MRRALLAVGLLLALLVGPANAPRVQAHPEEAHASSAPAREVPHNWQELVWAWEFDPGVVVPLLLAGALYARGVWGDRGLRRGVRRREVACFAGGWIALVVALVSPLHPWGEALFSAHMTQHEILMLVAAPLLVLGSPLAPTLRALPRGWTMALARGSHSPAWLRVVATLRNPMVAWAVHGVVLWGWHTPFLFDAAVENETVHALQHLSFLGSALLFWWALLHGRGRAMAYGAAVLYLFTTALHSGLLGALLTFSETPWYPAYAATAHFWGVSVVDDQQLGGLIMWVPACSLYLVVALALFARWLKVSGAMVSSALACGLMLFAGGCSGPAPGVARAAAAATGGDPERGRALIRQYGCVSCHTIPGVAGAHSIVGPPLKGFASRTYVAGIMANQPDNVIRWIQNPPGIDTLTAMPNVGVTERDARDITSYLYTLR